MEKIGIICEYNPFHNGHIYHIKKIKEMYPDSLIILVMSTYFTQRGELNILSKYDKVKISLKYGVDVVIELPTIYSLNSADIFAECAIDLLNKAGAEKIVFGSESNDPNYLIDLSKKLENKKTKEKIKKYLNEGLNYPTSLSKAIDANLSSNDLLGISYIKAINKINKKIEPITIKRTTDYNDLESNGQIVSGNNIREKFKRGENVSKYIPDYEEVLLQKIDYSKLFTLLKYKILTDNDLTKYLGVDEGIETRIKKLAFTSNSLDELVKNIKSKRYTYLRINRMLMHILLGIQKTDSYKKMLYFRVIGLSNKGKSYLRESKIDMVSFRNADRIYDLEISSCIIYDYLTNSNTYKLEIQNKPVFYKKSA